MAEEKGSGPNPAPPKSFGELIKEAVIVFGIVILLLFLIGFVNSFFGLTS